MTHKPDKYEKSGVCLLDADRAMIMVHGRGATAQIILELAKYFRQPGMAFIAPQATDNTWYPHSFMMPLEQNEPDLSSALDVIGNVTDRVLGNGIPPENIFLLGFSQGACLALEFAARNARRYGGIFGLSGGLIGPDGTPRNYAGDFGGTPVFLGCSDVDAHIPKRRVLESAAIFQKMGAAVDTQIYPGMPHTIIEDEINRVKKMLETVSGK